MLLFARWPLLFLASPACIFYSVSPPTWSFRRWRGQICRILHAGRCRSSPRRRAFFILFLRRLGHLDGAGGEFAAFCPLAAAVLRLAGVHFLFCFSAGCCRSLLRRRAFLISFSAGAIVLTVAGRNLSPFARWPLPFFASPACIFNLVSPPAWSSRRWRGRICRFLHAGCCRSLLRRRAFLISFLRRRYRFDGGGEEFVSFCTLAAAVLCFAGVHF